MPHNMPTDDEDAAASPNQDTAALKKKTRKDKIRAAWISFVGRIIAQIIGAAASIFFGVLILHKYQSSSDNAARISAASAALVARADDSERPAPLRARRDPGDAALAVLPLQNFSGDAHQDAFADAMTEALTAACRR